MDFHFSKLMFILFFSFQIRTSLLSWERKHCSGLKSVFSPFWGAWELGVEKLSHLRKVLKLSSHLLSHFPHRWLSFSSVSKMHSYVIWLCWIMIMVCSNPRQISDSPERAVDRSKNRYRNYFFNQEKNPSSLFYDCIALSYGKTYLLSKVSV